ncbi:MAG: glycosyltransferase family 39 protein, partial [Cyanobacteria bacterium Co-bin13]|nr:glycosyltransferase family 39 protein [Cyanobacteria bacterium Co-bin13]
MVDWLLRHRVGLFLVLWAGVLLLLHSPQQSYLAHDEGYYAQQARWILANNDWLTVGWWDGVYFDRTLAVQWLIALSFKLFGFSERAARVPSMLACLGAVLLTWRIGLHFSRKQVGGWGGAILVVIPVWMQASYLAVQDIILVCIELVGIWALLEAEQRRFSGRFWLGLLAGITVGLGFLVKTFMIVLPVVALLPYLVLEQPRHRHLSNRGLYLGLLLGFVPVALWLSLSVNRYGLLPLEQLFGKLVILSENALQIYTTPLFYLWNIPANSFPWAFFAIAGFLLTWRTPGLSRKSLWLGYPLLLLILLTVFRTRTWYYPLQLHPFMALL